MKIQSYVSCWAGIELDYDSTFYDLKVDYPLRFTREFQPIAILGDMEVFSVDRLPNPIKIAWLAGEPRSRMPSSYKFVEDNLNKFDKVFTFDKDLLALDDKVKFCPFGTTRFAHLNERQIFPKTKNISIIGNVRMFDLEGHHLRNEIVKTYTNKFDGIKHGGAFEDKHAYLDDYRFSVVVENTKVDYYFSEKLMDCLKVGAIPIYWGCPSILSKFGFDPKGLIVFDKLEDLAEILPNLDEKYYLDNFESVVFNFNKANEYLQCYHSKFIWEGLKEYDVQ